MASNDEVRSLLKSLQDTVQDPADKPKLNENDEGSVYMGVSQENGRVRIDFPKPVAWIAFEAEAALALAEVLMKNANALIEVRKG